MPDDKKKQAMSLLFGDAPARPQPTSPAAEPDPGPPAEPKAAPPAKPLTRGATPKSGESKRGGERPPPDTDVTPDPYYQGHSRYRRSAGEQVKHSVYLDPDVSRALKVAAATGDDPRGTNVSAIVNAALRELGYGE